MNWITYFDNMTGQITGQMSADDQSIEITKAASWIHCIDGNWSSDAYYVVNNEAVLRPKNTATLTGNTLQNLPVPCKITINGVVYDCDDQTATLELTQPIKYVIVVSAFPYLDKEFVIDYSA